MLLHEDRLFPAAPVERDIARRLYAVARALPILSPHGHTDPAWFSTNEPFANPSALFIQPDHYIFRMLYSQGIALESLGIGSAPVDPREVWRTFARHYFLFRGTPTRLWMDYAFRSVFGLEERLCEANADVFYDTIDRALTTPALRPRALYDSFRLEVLATTDSALDSLEHHRAIHESGWKGRVLPTFRPDACIDPEFAGFHENLLTLGRLAGEDTSTFAGYLAALRNRRAFFKSMGATATDHGHASANTADLPTADAAALYAKVFHGTATQAEGEVFQAQMLTEMAAMSVQDGLVMQLHPGSLRNHNTPLYEQFGRDKGADIPLPTDYVRGLRPLLNRFGNHPDFTFLVFTLDETTYARELAPLAGHYPCLRLGPAWWFHDSPEGMMRYREQVTETAGFYNTAGFNDDTRALLSIPARHDVARRVDCAFLARLVAEHRLDEDEAFALIEDLTVNLARKTYRL